MSALGNATPAAGGFGAVAGDIQPPLNAVEVNPKVAIRLPFNAALAPSTVDESSVRVTADGVAQAVNISLVNSGQSIEITPVSGTWSGGTDYVVNVAASVESLAGVPLGEAISFGFSTLATTSLVAWWEFDNSLVDLSGNGHDIDTNSGVSFADGAGEFHSGSHAAYFNGISQLVLSDAGFDMGSNFAVTTWICIPTLQSDINTIFSNAPANESPAGFKIGVNNWRQLDGRVIFEGGNGSVGGKIYTDPGFVQDGQWYHFAYNVDIANTLPNGEHVQIFFNGVEANVVAADNIADMDWSTMKTAGPIYFGAMVGGSNRLNGAYLDDMRVYNRPLTPAEVTNIAR